MLKITFEKLFTKFGELDSAYSEKVSVMVRLNDADVVVNGIFSFDGTISIFKAPLDKSLVCKAKSGKPVSASTGFPLLF